MHEDRKQYGCLKICAISGTPTSEVQTMSSTKF